MKLARLITGSIAAAFTFTVVLAESAAAEPPALSLDPDGYTVQLLAVPSADRLRNFVRERGVPNLIATEILRDGKPHYVLLLGLFPDRASAANAARDLPAALADLKPWVRPLSSLLAVLEDP